MPMSFFAKLELNAFTVDLAADTLFVLVKSLRSSLLQSAIKSLLRMRYKR